MGNNYIEASKQLHSDNKKYGAASEYSKPDTMKFMLTIPQAIKASQEFSLIRSILDHGTGKGGLIETLNQHKELDIIAKGYDPCVPEFSELPSSKFDIVTSIDVLEHLGIDYVGSTISEINNLTENFFFFCIDLVPASKMLNDGRNAHTLIAPSDWWLQQIKNKFKIISCIEVGKMSSSAWLQLETLCSLEAPTYRPPRLGAPPWVADRAAGDVLRQPASASATAGSDAFLDYPHCRAGAMAKNTT